MGPCREGRVKRFVPFMEGPRSCAGLALANMNVASTLALLYGRYTFRLADEVRSAILVLHGGSVLVTRLCSPGDVVRVTLSGLHGGSVCPRDCSVSRP